MVRQDGIRIMMADTDPDNARAVRFFERKGFDDQKAHLYMSTNLEQNENYRDLIQESREAALDAEYLKRIRKLSEDRSQSVLRKKRELEKKRLAKNALRKTRPESTKKSTKTKRTQ